MKLNFSLFVLILFCLIPNLSFSKEMTNSISCQLAKKNISFSFLFISEGKKPGLYKTKTQYKLLKNSEKIAESDNVELIYEIYVNKYPHIKQFKANLGKSGTISAVVSEKYNGSTLISNTIDLYSKMPIKADCIYIYDIQSKPGLSGSN